MGQRGFLLGFRGRISGMRTLTRLEGAHVGFTGVILGLTGSPMSVAHASHVSPKEALARTDRAHVRPETDHVWPEQALRRPEGTDLNLSGPGT